MFCLWHPEFITTEMERRWHLAVLRTLLRVSLLYGTNAACGICVTYIACLCGSTLPVAASVGVPHTEASAGGGTMSPGTLTRTFALYI